MPPHSEEASAKPPDTPSVAQGAQEMLARVWQKNEALFRERLRLLDAAVDAAESGWMSPAQRVQATGEAHKMAGSLGMFGYPQGSAVARDLEQMLDSEAAIDVSRFRTLVTELRKSLPL